MGKTHRDQIGGAQGTFAWPSVVPKRTLMFIFDSKVTLLNFYDRHLVSFRLFCFTWPVSTRLYKAISNIKNSKTKQASQQANNRIALTLCSEVSRESLKQSYGILFIFHFVIVIQPYMIKILSFLCSIRR